MSFGEWEIAGPPTPSRWKAVNCKEGVVGNLRTSLNQDSDDISALGAAEEVVRP
jgi:hypothetical protein